MALGSLLSLLDDITSILDDVAAMTKVAATKTAGVIGDDLALNAQQVMGSAAKRELPIIAKVAAGSLVNKVILVPLALLLSWKMPWLLRPLLFVGGAYLCYEGCEKIIEAIAHRRHRPDNSLVGLEADMDELEQSEKQKIFGAIRTDFVLSAEIVTIALGSIGGSTLMDQAIVLSIIAVAMTVGVYGIVALIVKIDDMGLWLLDRNSRWHPLGRFMIRLMPVLMRMLTIVGTAAMFVVGGGIALHNAFPEAAHHLTAWAQSAGWLGWLVNQALAPMGFGVMLGLALVGVMHLWQRVRRRTPA